MTNAVSLAQYGSTGVSQGFKNRIINGAMQIDQRNAGASVTNTTAGNEYTLDRWGNQATQNSKFTVQQNAGSVTPPAGFTNYLGVTSISAYTVGAGDHFGVSQIIEGFNAADLGWGTANAKTVTLSFWVRSSLTGTFGGCSYTLNNAYSYAFSYVINAANTWEYKTVTIVGPTVGSWSTTNTASIPIVFGLGTGSTYNTTAGSWVSGIYRSVTGNTSVVGTNGATFYITGVQLEVGSTATSFDYRPYGTELALCQRYFEWCSIAVWTGAQNYPVVYKVQKRTQPTIGNYVAENGLTNNFFANCPSSATFTGSAGTGTLGAYYSGAPNVNAVATFSSSAEL